MGICLDVSIQLSKRRRSESRLGSLGEGLLGGAGLLLWNSVSAEYGPLRAVEGSRAPAPGGGGAVKRVLALLGRGIWLQVQKAVLGRSMFRASDGRGVERRTAGCVGDATLDAGRTGC